ncbi:Hpt domain-containing protein [Fulvivirga sedimenti]|uniref:Hpt domain-containing protein n=1 Tax=Fulvivirga sedimenti TaxID=2879465 RepID=A0A9X1KWY4_9BACT|nr:Hpt domain-containing protein [Fulvivirga sedimenti]MCA6073712.1 Hpt domain-containing protein [Fulvivirga sedimenti]
MGMISDKKLLYHFENDELRTFCEEALGASNLEAYDPGSLKTADVVLSDLGLHKEVTLPGYVPVVLFIDDETPFPPTYYTREIDPAITVDQLNEEIESVISMAGIGRSIGLSDLHILNMDILESLSNLGSTEMVVNGLNRFIKNTTLQLNECRSLHMRGEYEQIRFIMHAMKGNAATLGGEQITRLCGFMEEELKSENYSNFEDKLNLAYTLLASFSFMSNGWYEK